MDAVKFLKSQHREVEKLFSSLEKTSDRAAKKREQLVRELIEKLTIHTKLEEQLFYPSAETVDEDLVLESLEEHTLVKVMVKKLSRTEASDPFFMARVTVLKEMVEHHVEEEEEELFPECEKKLSDEELESIGARMEILFEKLSQDMEASAAA